MYTLYLSKGSSALAAHILLEEIGAPYDTVVVSIPDKAHLTPDYLAINPKGRVPALQTPQGVLTENTAILAYLAQAHPEHALAPTDTFAFAQAQALNSYISSTLHVAFAHKARAARWADDPVAIAVMQAKVAPNIAEGAQFVEDHLIKEPWALGERYSMCDPYLFLVHRWMAASQVELADYPRLNAHNNAMRARPAVQAALAQHGL